MRTREGTVARRRPRCRCLALIPILLGGLPALAQDRADRPLGLILSSQGGRIIPLGDSSSRAAEPGDLLFAGDFLRSASGTVSFLFCPAQARMELAPNAGMRIAAAIDRRDAASVRATPAPFCALPAIERHPSAARLHFGDAGVRDADQALPSGPGLDSELAGVGRSAPRLASGAVGSARACPGDRSEGLAGARGASGSVGE